MLGQENNPRGGADQRKADHLLTNNTFLLTITLCNVSQRQTF